LVFDLDYTLLSVNTSYCYLKALYKKKVLSLPLLIKGVFIRLGYYVTPMSLERLHHLVFETMLKGFSLDVLEQHVDALVKELLPKYLYLPAYQELKAGQERGDYTVLFSSSPDFLVSRFAAYFGVDAWESTVYGVDKEHRLCKIAKLVVGTEKERFLLELQKKLDIPKERVVVYSDSHDDIPLLLQAGEAVAVNPDRRLAKMAKLHQWRVI
jgi:phosphoserine phosphatase